MGRIGSSKSGKVIKVKDLTDEIVSFDRYTTLMVHGQDDWYYEGYRIFCHCWGLEIVEYTIDGPNWAVEEVEARIE